MPRTVSANIQNILDGPVRKIDWTIDLTFPDASVFRYATAPLELAKGTYTNNLESVREIRQTMESATDRLGIAIQNTDRFLGQHVAVNWQKWRKAEAVIGRYYRGGAGLALTEYKEMFRGAVQQPNADDLQVTFDVITDVVSAGFIVCNRTLCPSCWHVFKEATTCGYSGGDTECNHHLKSKGGCDGKFNSHHYGGMEHRYNPDTAAPGGGGNPGGPIGGGSTGSGCPRIDQYTWARGEIGQRIVKMCGFLTEDDWLWNPDTGLFEPVESVELLRNVPIHEIIASNGAVGYSSGSHPVLHYRGHAGLAVERFETGDAMRGWMDDRIVEQLSCLLAQNTGELGDVVRITMKGGKVYCYGDNPKKMIICHNSKPVILE
jgi:hypothetical protein